MIYHCCDFKRKSAILDNPAITLNGIDYLEVLDGVPAPSSPPQQTSPPRQTSPPQRILLVHCLKAAPSSYFDPLTRKHLPLTPANVMIEGGESITDITVISVTPASPPQGNVLVVQTDKAGDFSTYRLRLVLSITQASASPFELTEVLPGIDPHLAEVTFSFRVECGPDFDCDPQPANCSPTLATPPPINYLAKDYGSFRTLILDRLNQLLPAWRGTSEADLGVVLAELIAYQGDYLSYQQDAIATEAYVETARSRVSLRRHARLVDYHVHDGCNARTWIQLNISADSEEPVFLDRTLTRFYTSAPGLPGNLAGADNEEAALLSGLQFFEPMQDAVLYQAHNEMFFYTWGNTDCCLPEGALEATLKGSYPNLQSGDVLIFKEVIGPQTGIQAAADLRHRCAVRLTQVTTENASGQPLVDPLFDQAGNPISNPAIQNPTPVTEIRWSGDDALRFPICISSTYLDSNSTKRTLTNVSVALGNVVLADHGLSISGKSLGTVPAPRLNLPPDPAADRCQPTEPIPLPVRFRPPLPDSPLTQAVPLPLAAVPITPNILQSFIEAPDLSIAAHDLMNFDPSNAVPEITLKGTAPDGTLTLWNPEQDLLGSAPSDRVFVVEIESNGTATLRFATPPDPGSSSDDTNGLVPDSGTAFVADYRIGNGTAGNVGAESLVHVVVADDRIQSQIRSCSNPLPARGGTDPETNDQIRRRAPQAFLSQDPSTLQRSVTMADYEAAAESNPQVDQAVASLRWMGSWYSTFIAVEPTGGGNLTSTLQKTLKEAVERYRLAGQDLKLESPQYVSLLIELQVCVDPSYFQSHVAQFLQQVLGNKILPNGQKGLFYPDNFTFGQTVYLSPVYAAARSVAGVISVTATQFQPQGMNSAQYLTAGQIKLGSLQVARLDNDPNFPDHGQLILVMQGGK